MALLDQTRYDKLLQLAHERFNSKLSPAEEKILRDSASSEKLASPERTAKWPVVRPAFIRWLATDMEAVSCIAPKGLRVYGATIPGNLDLEECHVNPILDFRCCEFRGEVNLQSAETRGIYIFASSLSNGISADRVIVHGPLFLQYSVSADEIRLFGAEIVGDLVCAGATLKAEGNALIADRAKIDGSVFLTDDFESEGTIRLLGAEITGQLACSSAKLRAKDNALSADGAKIGGNVFLSDGFESDGAIRLLKAEIEGQLNCNGARLKVKGDALIADDAKVGDSVFLDQGFKSEGTIRLPGAKIDGDLSFRDATVVEVVCQNTVIDGDLIWQRVKKSWETAVNLDGAKVKNLRDDKDSWPGNGKLDLGGLVYEELTLHESLSNEEVKVHWYARELPLIAKERIAWLMLQPPECRIKPQPWTFLSQHLEHKGDIAGARYVIFRYTCLQARGRALFSRLWFYGLAWLVEMPLRILWAYILIFFIGTLVFIGAFRSGAMIEAVRLEPDMVAAYNIPIRKPGGATKPVSVHYPPFQPFMYSMENAIPLSALSKFGMDERWVPDPMHKPQPWFPQIGWLDWLKWFNSYGFLAWFRWGLVLWGWLMASLLTGWLAGNFRK